MSVDLREALAVIEERQARLAELKSACADKAETIARLARGDLAGLSKTITLGICAMRKKISKQLVRFLLLPGRADRTCAACSMNNLTLGGKRNKSCRTFRLPSLPFCRSTSA